MNHVRCSAGTSPAFPITVGVHQGSALSPLLFTLCMDTATADLQSETENCLALQTQTQAWKDRLSENGMRLNIKKTEYLECSPQTNSAITIDGEPLTKVAQFKYLGSLVTSDCETLPDARLRVNTAWMKWHQVSGVLCDKRIPIYLKAKVYKSIVRPVALYGSECWPATTKHEQALHTMEMKMLRWPLGLTRLDRARNNDVRKQWGVTPITDKMREVRLRWYGHVVRSDKNSITKTAQQLDLEGNRPQGRPKKRWMDRIKDDMKAVNVTPEDALDRKKWRKACKIADPASRDINR
ncbi:uncharacterized protein LOC109196094 [Oreochromis niloticus]|uniref:uncharacterized protein LOC109196094 n=1 Tax=Oreochromis niloticus TaxID=8128 RepID=UPI000905C1A9|nr:uncharacterized protein LOC109196094 [Oreochromis niloticus]